MFETLDQTIDILNAGNLPVTNQVSPELDADAEALEKALSQVPKLKWVSVR